MFVFIIGCSVSNVLVIMTHHDLDPHMTLTPS